MIRTIAFVSAAALIAAISGCSNSQTSSNRGYPPPATPAQSQQAAAQTNPANAAGNSGTGMSSQNNQSSTGGMSGMAGSNAMSGKPSRSEVRQVQAALRRNGERLKVDGRWGPMTSKALRDYQQKNGLEASGELDDPTLRKLNVRTSG